MFKSVVLVFIVVSYTKSFELAKFEPKSGNILYESKLKLTCQSYTNVYFVLFRNINVCTFLYIIAPDPCKDKKCGEICAIGDIAGQCDSEGHCSFDYENLGCGKITDTIRNIRRCFDNIIFFNLLVNDEA